MAKLLDRVRLIIGALALAIAVAVAMPMPVSAQQSGIVNPTADAVSEQQLFKQLQVIQGRGTIPDVRSYVLVRPDGRQWREFHDVTLRWIGVIAILGMLALLVVFYLWRGMVKIEGGRSGRTIVRFNGFERFVHWMTATCFIILAITGLNVTFGRPLFAAAGGSEVFTVWSEWAKYAHDYLSFPFTIGVVLIFVTWIAGNIPNATDIEWFKRGGGLFGHEHSPSYRFNGGQKLIYWIVVIGGTAMAITGYMLMFPFYGTTVEGMLSAQMVHAVVAMLFIAVMLAHIYIGTVGMEGAFEAMGTGSVDVNWAKEHHDLWLKEEIARTGEAPRQPMATPAE